MNVNPQNRQRLLTFAALAAITLLVGDRLVLGPLIRSWRERSSTIVQLRKSVSDGRQLMQRDRAIHERWDQMRTNMLPAEVSAAEGRVLKAFDQWSRQSRVSITAIKPQWRRDSEEYSALECRVDGFGSLATITRFLHEIEKDPIALKVESVELTSRDKEGAQLSLGLQVSGLVLNSTTP